ncbi:MAG: hypothetical protein J5672_01145, partial [Verrucomicrobia bacterium]|nr:hypothetical protein [Verrucomicrobiota bacterium]
AGAYFTVFVFNNSVHRDSVKLYQLAVNRKKIEFFHLCGSFPDAVIEKHIEFQMLLFADSDQICYIHRFEESHHWIWSFHPKFKRGGSGCVSRISFKWHDFLFKFQFVLSQ